LIEKENQIPTINNRS